MKLYPTACTFLIGLFLSASVLGEEYCGLLGPNRLFVYENKGVYNLRFPSGLERKIKKTDIVYINNIPTVKLQTGLGLNGYIKQAHVPVQVCEIKTYDRQHPVILSDLDRSQRMIPNAYFDQVRKKRILLAKRKDKPEPPRKPRPVEKPGPDGIGYRLAVAMTEKGFTQTKVDKMAGSNKLAIQKIENGKAVHPKNIMELAKALGVNPAWLQFGEPYASRELPE